MPPVSPGGGKSDSGATAQDRLTGWTWDCKILRTGDGVRLQMPPRPPGWRMTTPTDKVLLGSRGSTEATTPGSILFLGDFLLVAVSPAGSSPGGDSFRCLSVVSYLTNPRSARQLMGGSHWVGHLGHQGSPAWNRTVAFPGQRRKINDGQPAQRSVADGSRVGLCQRCDLFQGFQNTAQGRLESCHNLSRPLAELDQRLLDYLHQRFTVLAICLVSRFHEGFRRILENNLHQRCFVR
jgi:hypothetical protein